MCRIVGGKAIRIGPLYGDTFYVIGPGPIAGQFAELGLKFLPTPGDTSLNQLVLNFGFGETAERRQQTEAVIARIVAEGVCYVAGAIWRGDWVMRISVSSAATTETDIDLSANAVIDAWRKVRMVGRY